MNREIFSFIICSYNGERCLEKAIQSLLHLEGFDTYVKQLILVNNNSTDHTYDIMNRAAKMNDKVVVVEENNPGLSNARLKGVNEAKADWIAFIDDDNYLDSDWLKYAVDYISSHKSIGSFGGAIVPVTTFSLSEEQKAILDVIYPSIAITHLRREDIEFSSDRHPNGLPYGAGMVVRTELMRSLRDDGWLSMEGRSGKKLTAGEDTEIGYYVEKSGYSTGYCPHMIIEHDIPSGRLTKEYAVRLYEGIMEAVYMLSGRDKLWQLRRIKYVFRVIKYQLFSSKIQYKTIEGKYRCEIEGACVKVIMRNLIADKFIIKNRYSGGK